MAADSGGVRVIVAHNVPKTFLQENLLAARPRCARKTTCTYTKVFPLALSRSESTVGDRAGPVADGRDAYVAWRTNYHCTNEWASESN
jgi:hypothetical protein